MTITARDTYLVVTRGAADAFRRQLGADPGSSVRDVMNVVVPLVAEGAVRRAGPARTGFEVVLRSRLAAGPECEIVVVLPRRPDGTWEPSPGGNKRMGFVVSFRVLDAETGGGA